MGLNIAIAFFLTSMQQGAHYLLAFSAQRWSLALASLLAWMSFGSGQTLPFFSMRVFHLVQRQALACTINCRLLQVRSGRL